ncbi:MAG: hypothetical protein PHU40_12670 [Sulfurimonas sp.]|nr:hypothetical protein [Sulfurimonas sp.]
MTQQWAIRGQMGDILSGHFSALAFLAVALSVFLQNEANRQMKLAFVQQSEALVLQSKSLEAQIEELQQSRKESERQTEEFFIANMNVKLDRYYKMFDNQVERIVSTNVVSDYISSKKIMTTSESVELNIRYNFNRSCNEIDTLLQIINAIHTDIRNLQNTYPQASQNFLSELKLKALCTRALHDIKTHYKEPSISRCIFFTEFFKV